MRPSARTRKSPTFRRRRDRTGTISDRMFRFVAGGIGDTIGAILGQSGPLNPSNRNMLSISWDSYLIPCHAPAVVLIVCRGAVIHFPQADKHAKSNRRLPPQPSRHLPGAMLKKSRSLVALAALALLGSAAVAAASPITITSSVASTLRVGPSVGAGLMSANTLPFTDDLTQVGAAPISEPASLVLLGTGLLVAVRMRSRR